MKSIAVTAAILAGLLASSASSAAFTDAFKTKMTDVQTKIMLNNQKFTPADVKAWWDAYDQEVLAFLNAKKPVESDLNKETAPIELSMVDHKGTEIDNIELGTIGVEFHQLDGKTWLAVLSNKMYSGSTPLPFGTVRFYKEVSGQYQRVAALDQMTGPWDKDKIQFSTVQFQPMGFKKGSLVFATFHQWPTKSGDKPNRSQIIWEYKDTPKPVTLVPEVDWHKTSDGTVVAGHGDAYDVPQQ
jgi:hypothetical protein